MPDVELRISTPLPMISTVIGTTAVSNNTEYMDRVDGLIAILTTHRMVFMNKGNGGAARGINLSHVQSAEASPKNVYYSVFKTAKIKIFSHVYGEVYIVFKDLKSRDSMLEKMELSLKRKAWLQQQDQQQLRRKNRMNGSNTSNAMRGGRQTGVGVAAIIARNRQKNEEAKNLSRGAFKEYEGLMQKAKGVQGIIERYSKKIEKDEKRSGGSAKNEEEDHDAEKLTEMLRSMGMTNNALTKGAAGSLYHQQLARQLVEFFNRGKLFKTNSGGMLTLVDVYCLFNRALGTNLVSPEDLLEAAEMMKSLKLGYSMVMN